MIRTEIALLSMAVVETLRRSGATLEDGLEALAITEGAVARMIMNVETAKREPLKSHCSPRRTKKPA